MQRRRDLSVIEEFFREPHNFRFFQAVRLLELWRAAANPKDAPDSYAQKYWRFVNSSSLSFPASEIAGAKAYIDDFKPVLQDELLPELKADNVNVIEITPTFLGLLGVQGALPLHYSERLAYFESQKRDPGARAFFDMFSNRVVYLFYTAWKKYRPAILHESDKNDRFLGLFMALAGLGHPALRNRLNDGEGAVPDAALARYTTALRQRPPSAKFIEHVLSEYFGTPLKIEQFIGNWYNVPERYQTELGGNAAVLGKSAHIGERVWQRNLRMRIRIGPLRAKMFENFLPSGDQAAALKKLLFLMTGSTFEYEIRLSHHKDDIYGCILDERNGARLGWDTFLCTQRAQQHRDDARYVIH
jgi:type VI secretion system protein ImpH